MFKNKYTIVTNCEVYNLTYRKGKMILTDSCCDYVTSGFWNICKIIGRETMLSFQEWDKYGNLIYNHQYARKNAI